MIIFFSCLVRYGEVYFELKYIIMATITELKQKRAKALNDIKFFLSKTSLSADETRSYNSLRDQITQLDRDISFVDTRNNFSSRISNIDNPFGMSEQEIKDVKRFSFVKFFRELAESSLSGIEREMSELGKTERLENMTSLTGMRHEVIPLRVLHFANVNSRDSTGQNVAFGSEGDYLVGTFAVKYLDALSNALILPKMGANFFTGLTGTLPIVGGGLFNAAFCEEGTPVGNSKMEFSGSFMKPKRVSARATFSKQLLKQSSIDIDNWVKTELIKANALAILTGALNGSGLNGTPQGILNTLGVESIIGGDNGAVPGYAHIVDLESRVADNNGDLGSLGYVTNSKVRAKLKQVLKSVGSSNFVWENKGMNEFYCGVTNACPSDLTKGTSEEICSAIIFGNWNDLLIGSWGGLDIVIDPFTRVLNNEIIATVHSFVNVALGHPKSFSAMKDALTD